MQNWMDEMPSHDLNLVSSASEFVDPVCGMTVMPETAAGSTVHEGQTYYFCNPHCLKKFQADPKKFLAAPSPSSSVEPAPAGTMYTCPMHPEVVSDHPGSCPKCGMALEPIMPSAEDEPNPELTDMTRRFWVGVALSLPIFLVAMGGMVPAWHHFLQPYMGLLNWVQLALATPVVLWCGWPFFERAWASLIHRSPNMFTLIALGVGAAYLYSLAATLAPQIFPEGFRLAGGAVEPYFDTSAVVTVLVLLGQVLELRARGQTSAAIKKLLGLAPKTARLVGPDGKEQDVPLELIQPGDLLRIRPGEKVPVDAVVVEGRSAVDESMISGEPIPVEKEPTSHVIGGTVNGTGSLLIKAEHVGFDTLLAQIVRLVSAAQRSRAPVERLVNLVSRYFVPGVLAVAVTALVAWGVWGPQPRLAHALVSAVAVLIIACPCALGLATPMAIMVGTGKGAETGVLFRDAEALEILHKADTLVVDKTGTLTEGKPRLMTIEPLGDLSAEELLRLVAGLEKASEHPLAAAIVKEAEARGLPMAEVRDFESVTGQGVRGNAGGRTVLIGTSLFLKEQGVEVVDLQQRMDFLRQEGQTVVLAALDGKLAGVVGVADPIRASTLEAIQLLHQDGLRIIMLTGDSKITAEAVARRLGIDEVIAEVLPQQKNEVVQRLQQEGKIVAMAGDGINDAPALAQAHVGIAMGTGTDIAMESAGVTLLHGDLRAIARARRLSRATMNTIRQNLFLAFVYNAVSIPVAAGVLYPFIGLLLSPIWASAAMSFSSLSVVGNSLRLRNIQL